MKDKITIGLFNDSFYPMADGVIMVLDNYARRLAKYANVIVFVPNYISKKYDDSNFPYKVVRCNSIKIPFLDYSLPAPLLDLKFKKILKKSKLDIVHIHSPFTLGKEGLKYAKKHNIPCIATMHSQFEQDIQKVVKNEYVSEKINNDFIIKVFNKCDECWAVNSEVARIYHEDYHYKTMPKVMNNATEMKPVKDYNKARQYINKLYGLDEDELVLLFVGRINTLKNILFIADSIKKVSKLKPELKFKMLYVGSGQDEDKLINHVKELGIENNTIMCGKVTDRDILANYYARADLFLFPSKYDASSIVQIEAASQKTPGLFLKGTATSSTVTDNVNGFLSDDSVDAYANKIIEIVENKKLYNKVCENSFKDLYKNWDDVIKEVYDLYLKIINEKK